jgi:hypothetical protein
MIFEALLSFTLVILLFWLSVRKPSKYPPGENKFKNLKG